MFTRRILMTAATALLSSMLSAGFATAQETIQTLFSVFGRCTSIGQLCEPPFVVSVETESVLRAQYFVPGHCSSIRVHFLVDGSLAHTSGFLGWLGAPPPFSSLPRDTGLIDLGPVSAGLHQIGIQAEGQVSGCNVGQLNSWAGLLLVVTSIHAVSIDIRPGTTPNNINLGSNGTVPVAILSSAEFDARNVNPTSVTLASAGVSLRGNGTPMTSFQDVNDDGFVDLTIHISTEALQLSETDTEAVLDGRLFNGARVRGRDTIRIVP